MRNTMLSALFVLGSLGCSSRLDVTRSLSPADAVAHQGGHFTIVGVERGKEIIRVPSEAHVEADRVVWPNDPGVHVHTLADGDVIERDAQGRIVAVRSSGADPIVTRFVPGTASRPDDFEVRGRLADAASIVPLRPGDRVRMTGTFESDEPIPGGGHVKTTRSTGLIVGGVALLALSYAPSAYVGVTSSARQDHDLVVPFAGPWIDLAERPKCSSAARSAIDPADPCLVDALLKAALVVGGTLQDVSAVLIAAGVPSSTRVSYENDRVAAKASVTVVPQMGGGTTGVRAVGTF